MRKYFIQEVIIKQMICMSQDHSTRRRMREANEEERKYQWLVAAKSYEQALGLESESAVSAAEIYERIGFCYNFASRQSENHEEFERLIQLSVKAYNNAAELFAKDNSLINQGKSARCSAIAEYLSSWLAPTASQKRRMLDECLKFGKKGLVTFENAGSTLNYANACNDLLSSLLERLYVASDSKEMIEVAQEGIGYADRAISTLLKLNNKSELLRAYFATSLLSWYAANITEDEEKRKELIQKSLDYSNNALALSKEVANPYFTALSNWAAAVCTLLFTEKVESSLKYAEEMLEQASVVKDNYLRGVAYYVLAFVTDWMMLSESDPDKRKEGRKKIIKYAEDAMRYLQLVSQDFFIAETCLFYAESYSSLASDEVNPEEKRVELEKAAEIGRKGLEHAIRSGSPDATGSTLHALSKALNLHSTLETRRDEKKRLLEEALIHRKEYNKIVETAFSSNDWINGVGKNYEGLIKKDLAEIETEEDKKRALLETAVLDIGSGISRCRKSISSNPIPTRIVAVGIFGDGLGEVLSELYTLTENEEILQRAIKTYHEAAEDFKKADLPSRVAESYWKMARNQDRLGKHMMASESFGNALAEYKIAAHKNQHFADFYLDYATYMEAWSEVERAKSAHNDEEYAIAMKHYEKTANLLKPSRLWSYLSPNFLAWSLLEHAEDLSRNGSSADSIEAFNQAAKVFKEAKEVFEKEINKIQNLDEKEKAVELSEASARRKDYCLARVNLEEARIFDQRGDYAKSAERYNTAATMLEKILEDLEIETEREEIKPFAVMCRAWQKMKMADVRVSPELYHEASELFRETKECSTKEKTILLASGNGAFCEALAHGTKFEATREKDDFSKTKQYLESAANYYLRAGFDNASLWTSATQILFDAYNYIISAEIEGDPEKKTKIYLLAEKCLNRSAELYETAGYIGKRDEVLRTLSKVKEKREFALSLGELMTAPSEASSTSIISAPGMNTEEPVGFSKFERAFVQANLIAHQTDVLVGGDVSLEIHLVNLGKNAAFLVKVEEIIPESFDLIETPERCTVDDGFLNLKGRKLAPLETDKIQLTFKPRKKGKFAFTPKVQYMDETGESKSCELEQVSVVVKELGIRGWLRGEG
jgi:hypothetical protein